MGAALGPPHPHRTRPDTASKAPIRFFFLFGPIPASETDRYSPIPADTATETGWNGLLAAILLLHVALWEKKKKRKKKKEKEEEDEKTQRNG